MRLDIIRKRFNIERPNSAEVGTIGDFLIDGKWFYYTMEDKDRQRLDDGTIIPWTSDIKIPKVTAIPRFTYEVTITYSDRFKRLMPLILNVPDFSGIRIHNGSFPENTEGCPLIGYYKNPYNIYGSKDAFADFFKILTATIKKEKVWLTVQ